MKNKGNEDKSEILAMSEKKLHKVTSMCSSLKKTRIIAKKPKKVDLNLKKVKFKIIFKFEINLIYIFLILA